MVREKHTWPDMSLQQPKSDVERVIAYHERTKHHPHRYAKSPGYLDWEHEPNPFRLYEGAAAMPLFLSERDPEGDYGRLYERRPGASLPCTAVHISTFLELSVGLSAWKSFRGNSWPLRMNPSSGNLHPTEVYLILPPRSVADREGGVYHYNPLYHSLEQRASFGQDLWSKVAAHFGTAGFLVALSSIYWREAWKYGERAFRYCNHDVGHALACLSFSGSLLGWGVTYLNALSDEEIERMLGFDRTEWRAGEREHVDLMCYVHGDATDDMPRDIPAEIIEEFQRLPFAGTPNLLSSEHVRWDAVDEVSLSTVKPKTAERRHLYPSHAYVEKKPPTVAAAEVIRRRRSGQAYDATTFIGSHDLFAMLGRTVPRSGAAPFDTGLGETAVHLLLFVHRVRGLEPGLYLFLRDTRDLYDLQSRSRDDFLWERVADAPEPLPLYLLRRGDFREEAATLSCHQEIAGDGAFSVGMLAKFRDSVTEGPFLYRRLFWEAGMVGQILYLDAEARGVRGTGIGCFFDDLVHETMGFRDNAYQSLYHFTVGRPVEDSRITTLPPYHHLKGHRGR